MQGLMQAGPLTISTLVRGMERQFHRKGVTTWRADGTSERRTYGEIATRARQLASVLDTLDVPAGARVGTFGWNSARHLELFVGVPASGRVLHTINHRLFADQITYIVDHAEDDILVVDASILATVWPAIRACSSVRHVLVMDDDSSAARPDDGRLLDYDTAIDDGSVDRALHVEDERTAATLCYTSGTTGDPKGVLNDHRSVVLHALMLLAVDGFGIRERDVVMPIVPMFHVCAWGLPYAAIMVGAELSMPGSAMAPQALARQLERDRVTFAGAVPTIWRSLLPELAGRDLGAVRKLVCGGGALPDALSRAYVEAAGLTLTGAWGMTETSPLVTHSRLGTEHDELDEAGRRQVLSTPGQAMPLTALRVMTDDGDEAPWDGVTPGELQVSGPTIARAYYDSPAPAVTEDGWLHTGDVATIDEGGVLRIVDRVKDLIKSGGEWISSVELEDAIMTHPEVLEAAVTPVEDERWFERPKAWVVLDPGVSLGLEDLRAHLVGRVAAWWMPDQLEIISELPRTATGKVSKRDLKKRPACPSNRTEPNRPV